MQLFTAGSYCIVTLLEAMLILYRLVVRRDDNTFYSNSPQLTPTQARFSLDNTQEGSYAIPFLSFLFFSFLFFTFPIGRSRRPTLA